MRVAFPRRNLARRIPRPRLHVPLPADDCRRWVEVERRVPKRHARLPAAPRGIIVCRRIPIPRNRARVVLPNVMPIHKPCDYRPRRWREIRSSRRAARLRTRAPICGLGRVHKWIALRERRTAAIRRDRPIALVAVSQFIHRPVIVIAQPQRIAGVIQRSNERPHRARIHGRSLRHYEPPAAGNDGAIWKIEVDSARQPPAREIDIHSHDIRDFHKLRRFADAIRVVVDFVKNDDGIVRRCSEELSDEES